MSEAKTFRDFAAALGDGNDEAAAAVLVELLAIDPARAEGATAHFRAEMAASPQFMMKAMGMRGVVEKGDAAALASLLGECFGLEAGEASGAAAALLARYG